jgi:hypothetical protein
MSNSENNMLIELASLDESADYEVDITEICYDPINNEFVLRTASGCSCWDGDYDEERFATLDEIYKSMKADDRTYNPSLSGADQIYDEAKKAFKDYQEKLSSKN